MMYTIALGLFLTAGLCGTWRLLVGPGLADRIMALDVTLMSLMGAITVHAAWRSDTTYLILLVVIAIVGFTATLAASKFLEYDNTEIGDTAEQVLEGDHA